MRAIGDRRQPFAREVILKEARTLGVCREDRSQLETLARFAYASPGFRAVVPVRIGDDHHELVTFEVCHTVDGAEARRIELTAVTPTEVTPNGADHLDGSPDADEASTTDTIDLPALLTHAAMHTPDLVAVFPSPGRPLRWSNDAFRSRLSLPPWAAPHLVELLDDWSQGHFVVKVLPDLMSQGWWQGRLAMVGPDVDETVVSATIVTHRGPGGEIDSLILAAQPLPPTEVDDDRRADEADHFAALVEHVSDLIAVIEPSGIIRYASPAATTMLGQQPGELNGVALLDLLHPDDAVSDVAQLVQANGEGNVVQRPTSLRLRAADDTWRFLEVVVSDLAENPAIGGYVLNARYVTERMQANELLSTMAYTDAVSGLPNRLRLLDRLSNLLEERDDARPVAMLVIGLEGFRAVHERHGSEVGDAVVIEVGDRLARGAGEDALVARLRDDEFGIVLPGIDDANVAERAAEALRVLLSRSFDQDGRSLRVTASIGIALGKPGEQAEDVLRHASRAASKARSNATRNMRTNASTPIEHWDDELARREGERRQVEEQLQRVLDDDVLSVHYQPIVRIDDLTVVGAEALLRVRNDEGPLLNPAEFVEAAESAGLIAHIGAHMLRSTCDQLSLWGAQLRADAPEHICVNVSPRQLLDPGLSTQVMVALEAASIEPERLWLEVTESTLIGQHDLVSDRIRFLRKIGVRVGLDEFGAGYSTLDFLRRFPLDFVKIDRSLVTGLGVDERDSAIVRATVELADGLGLTVVAVGVEEQAQLDQLRALGCDHAQGYLFFPPLDAQAVVTQLQRT